MTAKKSPKPAKRIPVRRAPVKKPTKTQKAPQRRPAPVKPIPKVITPKPRRRMPVKKIPAVVKPPKTRAAVERGVATVQTAVQTDSTHSLGEVSPDGNRVKVWLGTRWSRWHRAR